MNQSNCNIVNFKNKTVPFLPAKIWVDWGVAENCNLRGASFGKTIGKFHKQRRGTLFYGEEWGGGEGLFWMTVHWGKVPVQGDDWFLICWVAGVVSFLQGLQCTSLPVEAYNWWVLPVEILLLGSVIDNSSCNWLEVVDFQLLASQFHFSGISFINFHNMKISCIT